MSNEAEYLEIMSARKKERDEFLTRDEAESLERREYDRGYDNGWTSAREALSERCHCSCKKCGCCR